MYMKILGIESSCDETAAALLEVISPKRKLHAKNCKVLAGESVNFKIPSIKVLINVVLSQTEIHKKYGGVVPEAAARAHLENINLVIEKAIGSNFKPDLIAVTKGPGLITALQVGVQAAKTLSYVWRVPLIGVNHLEGHLWSFLLNKESGFKNIKYLPAVALIVSGGHTELILVNGIGKYKLIGRTLDDAAGEVFDKVAKMLGLGYPGGHVIAMRAEKGNSAKINFPRPMINSSDFNFSFSGLKTSVKYYLMDTKPAGKLGKLFINDVSASFQQSVVDVLVGKTIKAAEKYKVGSIILGGGVSANEKLIQSLTIKAQNSGINCLAPEKWLAGDNASMIALAGYFNKQKSSRIVYRKLVADANLILTKN